MMTNDLINSVFEFAGAFIVSINIYKLYQDKLVRGIHYSTVVFFASWGFWNIHYYPSLDQVWSGVAALVMALTNTVYLVQILYYRNLEKQNLLRETQATTRY